MISVDNKNIKLQIWDTVRATPTFLTFSVAIPRYNGPPIAKPPLCSLLSSSRPTGEPGNFAKSHRTRSSLQDAPLTTIPQLIFISTGWSGKFPLDHSKLLSWCRWSAFGLRYHSVRSFLAPLVSTLLPSQRRNYCNWQWLHKSRVSAPCPPYHGWMALFETPRSAPFSNPFS